MSIVCERTFKGVETSSISVDDNNSFSYFCWVKSPPSIENSSSYVITNQQDGTGNGRSWLAFNNQSEFGTDFTIFAFMGGSDQKGTTIIQPDTLYHCGMVFRHDQNNIKLYLNGELDYNGSETIEANDAPINIGKHKVNTTNAYEGLIFETRFYTGRIYDDQVRALYRSGGQFYNPTNNNLELWYRYMEEPTGTSMNGSTVIKDFSGNGRDGSSSPNGSDHCEYAGDEVGRYSIKKVY